MTDPINISGTLEVIAAFADGERVDTAALREALASADGRDYLIDLVALREVVRAPLPTLVGTTASSPRPRPLFNGIAIAAALALTLLGGYVAGHRAASATSRRALAAPAPDRVINLKWDDTKQGH